MEVRIHTKQDWSQKVMYKHLLLTLKGFIHVARIETVQFIIALAASNHWEVHHLRFIHLFLQIDFLYF